MTSFPNRESRYPQALIDERHRLDNGEPGSASLRDRIRFDLVARPHHACGLLAAADVARFCGLDAITAIEFGVAEGGGLKNLVEVAHLVTAETGIEFHILGFDNGTGLPPPLDARDHPEIWSEGDFAMGSPDGLAAELGDTAELVIGPIDATLPETIARGFPAPIGFVSLDMDYYSSTATCLEVFDQPADQLTPVVISYFDDVTGHRSRIGSIFRTRKAGQFLAIDEFNAGRTSRSIDPLAVLRQRRPFDREPWLDKMYGTHILDHPVRSVSYQRDPARMERHGAMDLMDWPL